MLVMTTRDECRAAMMTVVGAIPNWRSLESRLILVRSFGEAHRALLDNTESSDQTMVVDLGSIGRRGDELVRGLWALRADYPWLTVVLLSPLLNPDLEVQAIHALRTLSYVLVERDDMSNVARWKDLLHNTFVELRAAQIEADLMVVSADAAAFFNDPDVRQLLRVATTARTVAELGTQLGCDRTELNRRFQRRIGRAPKEVLALFRLVWAVHLRVDGRTPAQIASFLGFKDTDHCALLLGRKLGLKKEQINNLAYDELVQCVAHSCTSQRTTRVKRLVSTLVRKARAILRRGMATAAIAVAACSWDGSADDLAEVAAGVVTVAVIAWVQV